ncbi:MAG: hypothetical protein MIO93_06235 [ANME-2 cluster archaeon]|nr:hypothetical protein [ANME-2 cluster archaeon]
METHNKTKDKEINLSISDAREGNAFILSYTLKNGKASLGCGVGLAALCLAAALIHGVAWGISGSWVCGLRPCRCVDHPGCHAPDAGRSTR